MSNAMSVALLFMLAALCPAVAAEQETQPDAAQKREMPFLGGFLRETRIVYPLAVGEWKAVGEHRYELQEAGVSVRYAHGDDSDRWIDMYFYPVGTLSDEQVATLAGQERDALHQAWVQGPDAKEDDLSELHTLTLTLRDAGGKAKRVAAYSADLTYAHEGSRRNSAMVVLFDRLYMVKARFSIKDAALSRRKARKMLEAFTSELAPNLTFTSSGGCWMPLPIEPLAADEPVPEGSLLSMQTDGQPTEYVYPDRVLARDPESTSAKTAMMLGMAMQHRMFPGCDGSDTFNPEVPRGMREIRIEYRAPDGSPTPARPARAARSGVG